MARPPTPRPPRGSHSVLDIGSEDGVGRLQVGDILLCETTITFPLRR